MAQIENTVTLEDVVHLAKQLSAVDKMRLIERVAPDIEQALEQVEAPAGLSLWGLWAGLGPVPSAEEIDEARREEWANFPRDDI